MRYRLVARVLGKIMILISLSMFLPSLLALYYGEQEWRSFIYSSAIALAAGLLLSRCPCNQTEIRRREGCVIVTLAWIAASLFGALPYLFAGTFNSLADALFETVSGFTTTGASVMTDIEVHPRSILFWRGMTQWLGGMGIVVLFVALLPQPGTGGLQMLQAEAPGPVPEKIKPRVKETAKVLWLSYVALSAAEVLLLWTAGMPLYDAVVHTFTTMATGGFSSKNASIGHYQSPVIHWIVILFMFLAGANFALYYQAFRLRDPLYFWRNPEFKLYSFLIVGAAALVAINLWGTGRYEGEYLVRQATFQVVSMMTTTGFVTDDFDAWPNFSRLLLLILMFIGGCYGSTGGSIKVGRHLVLLKNGLADLYRIIHPHAVVPVRLGGAVVVKENLIMHILQFIGFYALIFVIGTLLLSLTQVDLVSAASAVAATLGNVGPGLGSVGPTQNFAHLPPAAKCLLSWLMLVGRLEIYTVLVLLLPATWKK